ncbi:ankyrin repeat protein [Cotonvirus japonicus]|uniref:Ankyrin repeat protein n=1 Tax=Cotonvirus japonicus TaxID=2811091 RepID=A0ABM7NUB7_9VIRU|nr:ankyrin repeat protein [Cotonvirus japonicus]BCS83696.1 ankyrin repeat protein [Cotonvirus japonicus]
MSKYHHYLKKNNKPYVCHKPDKFQKKSKNYRHVKSNLLKINPPKNKPSEPNKLNEINVTNNAWMNKNLIGSHLIDSITITIGDYTETYNPECDTYNPTYVNNDYCGEIFFPRSSIFPHYGSNLLYPHCKSKLLSKYESFYSKKISNSKIIKILFEDKINFLEKDIDNMNHLMCACFFSQNDNNIEIVKILLNLHINVNARNRYGETALLYSLKFPGNIEIIKLLLKHGANIDAPNQYYLVPFLYWSQTKYQPDIIIGKLLLDAGTDINTIDNHGSNALINIILNDSSDNENTSKIVTFLLSKGIDFNQTSTIFPIGHWNYPWDKYCTGEKWKPLNYAYSRYKIKGDFKTLQILLNYSRDYLLLEKIVIKDKPLLDIIESIKYYTYFFKTINEDLKETCDTLLFKPGGIRSKIMNINWNLNLNIVKNCICRNKENNHWNIKHETFEKCIEWNNFEIFNYFGICDTDKLKIIINESMNSIMID